MNIDEEIKRLKTQNASNPLSLSQMAKIAAAALDRAAIQWAFNTYWDKKFLKLAKINELNQTEKDRIFNELILAGETLIMLTLDAPDLRHNEDFREYLHLVKDQIAEAHDDELKNLRVERSHRKLWKKLIKIRLGEYAESKLTARKAMMEYEAKKRDLEIKDLEGINLTLPPFMVSVGVYKHIIRDKENGRNLLFKLIMKKLGRFYVEIRIITEGGKISPTIKVRMKLRHFWNDIKETIEKPQV